MRQSDFTDQLKTALQSTKVVSHAQLRRSGKESLMATIKEMSEQKQGKLMLAKLAKYYQPAKKSTRAEIKASVMSYIHELEQENAQRSFGNILVAFTRKSLATSFAFILVFTLVIGPFQTLGPVNVFPVAQAVLIQCFGTVYLNGHACSNGQLSVVSPGDDIKTSERATATIFYPDYKLVRLDKNTELVFADLSMEQIIVESGSVWLNSPSDSGDSSLKVATPILLAKVPKGAVGLTTKKNTTHFYTTTAAVDVQIDSRIGSTELITIPPEKSVVISQNRRNALVREIVPTAPNVDWVQSNRSMDESYIEVAKERTVDETKDLAGIVPGSIRNYISKLASTAHKSLTWDDDNRLALQLSELEKIFVEVLVVLREGDQTTAMKSFEVYHDKFISLLQQESDIMPQEISGKNENKVVKLFERHNRLVSLFSLDDNEYLLKIALQDLSTEVNRLLGNDESQEVIANVSSQLLLEASNEVSEGKIAQAEEILRDVVSKGRETSSPQASIAAINTGDLIILDDIADKSLVLEPIVEEIKKQKVAKIRSLTAQNDKKEVVAHVIKGTAYKETDSQENDDSEDNKTVKIVGQAIKPSEDAL